MIEKIKEQNQESKNEISRGEIIKILECLNKEAEESADKLIEMVIKEKNDEDLSDEETVRRSLSLSRKIVLVQLRQTLGISKSET